MSAKKAALITVAMLVAMIAIAGSISANSVEKTMVAADGYGISAYGGQSSK